MSAAGTISRPRSVSSTAPPLPHPGRDVSARHGLALPGDALEQPAPAAPAPPSRAVVGCGQQWCVAGDGAVESLGDQFLVAVAVLGVGDQVAADVVVAWPQREHDLPDGDVIA